MAHEGPNAVARGGKTYEPIAGGPYRRGPRRYVPYVSLTPWATAADV
jgi:hypothetical protein